MEDAQERRTKEMRIAERPIPKMVPNKKRKRACHSDGFFLLRSSLILENLNTWLCFSFSDGGGTKYAFLCPLRSPVFFPALHGMAVARWVPSSSSSLHSTCLRKRDRGGGGKNEEEILPPLPHHRWRSCKNPIG